MAHAVAEQPQSHMGLPLPNGKLAMWMFLVTEIMFFTALIGVYMILRNSTPETSTGQGLRLAKPHEVHLVEEYGAINTFVLICSSLTVVLAHWALMRGNVKQTTIFVAVTLALGAVFLVIKAHRVQGQVGPSHSARPSRREARQPRGRNILPEGARPTRRRVEGPSGCSRDRRAEVP